MMSSRRSSNANRTRYILAFIALIFFVLVWQYIQPRGLYVGEFIVGRDTRVGEVSTSLFDRIQLYMKSNTALYEELRTTQALLQEEQNKNKTLTALEKKVNLYEAYSASSTSATFGMRIGSIDAFISQSFRTTLVPNTSQCTGTALVTSLDKILLGTLGGVSWNGVPLTGFLERLGVPVEVVGNKDGSYTGRIPRTLDVARDDILLLDVYKEVIVGNVVLVDDNEGEAFKKITFSIPFAPSQIGNVALICAPY
jgi:hypothetical protein